MEKTKESSDRFLQGYLCAVASMISKEGGVPTLVKELFDEGTNYNIKKWRKSGVDEHDIEIFKSHRKELKHNRNF